MTIGANRGAWAGFVLAGAAAMAVAADTPWPAQYKIKPGERQRLTAADVVGPDGIVYPNWTQCGVRGGIPRVAEAAKIADFGGVAGDGRDDAEALDQACETVGARGGGAVVLGPGTYHMDRPVTIRRDNVVIRGQGMEKTKILFRYALPAGGAAFYGIGAGDRLGAGTGVELHCRPAGLMKMAILVDGAAVARWERSTHSGNTFWCRASGSTLAKVADGPHVLRGVGEYKDGTECAVETPIVMDRSMKARTLPSAQVAICFQGAGETGPRLRLARDGRRGDMGIELESAAGLAAGDAILIEGPATERWKALTANKCPHGSYRRYNLLIERVAGNTVHVTQPLRIEFPVVDGSYVQKTVPLQRCGVEDFTIEQTEDLWITAVEFRDAWNCWARGVSVRKCGRNPVYASDGKWCEIRDCVFDDAWYKGGGGTAYGGWENCCDCLMDGIETFKLRHAPLVQWAASGCVIRNGVFHDSDAQWHSGWTNENLFEKCVVKANPGNGAYGYGAWASPPEDAAHGPNGPRNVVYNCDITSPKTGLWMGGMNEAWIIAYNRFSVARGPGVFMKTSSFDHLIRGNVFSLSDAVSPMVEIKTADCTGVEVEGNRLFGGSRDFAAGAGKPVLLKDNQARAAGKPDRPQPKVPSIYEWQLQQARPPGK